MPIARRRTALTALAVGAALTGFLVQGLGTAFAADPPFDPGCYGSIALGADRAEGQVTYTFTCNGDITAYGVFARNRGVDSFDTEAIVLDSAGNPASGQAFGCAGQIPSTGVSCSGLAAAYTKVSSSLEIDRDPCLGTKPNMYVYVTDAKGRIAGPFLLNNAGKGGGGRPLSGCPKIKPASKRKARAKARRTRGATHARHVARARRRH